MGVPTTRMGDLGVGLCTAHGIPPVVAITTVMVQGIPTVISLGKPTSVIGSIGTCSCGHPCVAIMGAITVKATMIGVHRQGDLQLPPSGSAVSIMGAPTVLTGP